MRGITSPCIRSCPLQIHPAGFSAAPSDNLVNACELFVCEWESRAKIEVCVFFFLFFFPGMFVAPKASSNKDLHPQKQSRKAQESPRHLHLNQN